MKKIQQNLIWVVLLLALALRLPYLDGSFWLDEAAQALESARPLSQQLDIIPDFQPPLLHLIVHFSLMVSQSEWWLRTMAALIPGLLTIAVVYWWGKKLVGRAAALLASLLLATSSLHIFYSQELRPYSLPTFWAVLSWWVLHHAVRAVGRTSSSGKKWWIIYTLVSILGVYTSYLYPFLVLAQGLWILLQHRLLLRQLCLSGTVMALSFLPWLPMFRLQLAAGSGVRVDLPGWESVVSLPQLKALPLVLGKFIFGVIDLELNLMFVTLMLILTAMIGWMWLRARGPDRDQQWSSYWLLAIWWLVPLIGSWLISFWIPVVQPKRLLFLLPAVYLLISSLVIQSRGRVRWLVATLLLMFNLYGTFAYYGQPALQRENWRAAYQQLIARYPASETIAIFVFPEPFAPWRWYNSAEVASVSTGTLNIDDAQNLDKTIQPVNDYKYVVVFDYLRDLTDPDEQVLEIVEANGFQPVDLLVYPQIGWIRIYSKKEFRSASIL